MWRGKRHQLTEAILKATAARPRSTTWLCENFGHHVPIGEAVRAAERRRRGQLRNGYKPRQRNRGMEIDIGRREIVRQHIRSLASLGHLRRVGPAVYVGTLESKGAP